MINNLWDWMNTFDQEYRFVTLIVAMALTFLAIVLGFHAWRRARESTNRARIVRDMLNRGCSTEEITRVLLASDLSARSGDSDTLDPDEDPDAYVVKYLTDHWYNGSDIQKVLNAAREDGGIDATSIQIIKSMADGWSDAGAMVKVLESRRENKAAPAVATSMSS
ncbi:MAG: hypothetical protein ACYTHJ_13260 [Planctomycetota bacterium]|jgi:hypothetical protein